MKLRYGIPLTILLLSAASWLSGYVPFNAYYLLVVVSALWIAIDSKVIGIERHRTQLALPSVPLAIATIVAWPVMFPVYLRTRYRIRAGEIAVGEPSRRVSPAVLGLVGLVVLVEVGGWWLMHSVRQDLLPEANGISQEFHIPVSLDIRNEHYLTVSLSENAVPDSAKKELAEKVAEYAWAHFPERPKLKSVAVQYVEVRRRGIVTVMNSTQFYQWSGKDLQALKQMSGPAGK